MQRKYINHPLMIAILVIPLIEPYGIAEMAMYLGGIWRFIDSILSIFKWISVFGTAMLVISNIKKRKSYDRVIFLMIAYHVWIITVALIRGNFYITNIKFAVASICIVILFNEYINFYNASKFLSVIETLLLLWIIINFLCLVIYPTGMYTTERGWRANWFLGYRNVHIYYYIPYLAVSGIDQYIRNRRIGIKYYLVITLIVVSALLAGSYTTLIAMGLFGLLFYLFGDKKLLNKINILTLYFSSIIISILFIFFNYQNSFLNEVINFLGNIIGRNVSASTMSSRNVIWARAIMDFFQHPLIGNGNISYSDIFSTWSVSQAHNMYLDIVVIGGIVLLVLFSAIVIGINKRVIECKNPELYNIATILFLALAILFITEARHDTVLLFIYLISIYFYPALIKNYSISDKSKRLKIRISRTNIR